MASREPGHREAPLPRSWASLSQDALAKFLSRFSLSALAKLVSGVRELKNEGFWWWFSDRRLVKRRAVHRPLASGCAGFRDAAGLRGL